jgi:hypothetical protein
VIRRIKVRTKHRHSARPPLVSRATMEAILGARAMMRSQDAVDAMVYTFSGRRSGRTEQMRRMRGQ